jgi:hypothetical protein
MSYLRGPLTRLQIKKLMKTRRELVQEGKAGLSEAMTSVQTESSGGSLRDRPVIEAGVDELFLGGASVSRASAVLRPHLMGVARVHFVDRKTKLELQVDELSLVLPLSEDSDEIDWSEAEARQIAEQDLYSDPSETAHWQPLPALAGKSKSYTTWSKELADTLYRSQMLELFASDRFKVRSDPGEDEREFRIRLADLGRERRDSEVEKLRERYAKKAATLGDRVRRARAKVEKEKEQASSAKLKTAISIGAALLSVFTGRKGVSKTDLNRAGSALKGIGRSTEQSQDVDRAAENVEALVDQIEELNRELEDKILELSDEWDAAADEIETLACRPRRSDIEVRRVALLWVPE